MLTAVETPELDKSMRSSGFNLNSPNRNWQQVHETQPQLRIGLTINYMKEHLNEPLRAATLAAVAKMSLPHYFVIFKRCTGSTPIDYFIKLRMERARELLATTSCSVKEIAGMLGYDDPLYFSRVFKGVNETTPTQYRASHKAQVANGSGQAGLTAPVRVGCEPFTNGAAPRAPHGAWSR
jgi:AraC-like DNA-binding protein